MDVRRATAAWFRDSFVDGYDWVMVTNVVGMALYADGGRMATKPYAGLARLADRDALVAQESARGDAAP